MNSTRLVSATIVYHFRCSFLSINLYCRIKRSFQRFEIRNIDSLLSNSSPFKTWMEFIILLPILIWIFYKLSKSPKISRTIDTGSIKMIRFTLTSHFSIWNAFQCKWLWHTKSVILIKLSAILHEYLHPSRVKSNYILLIPNKMIIQILCKMSIFDIFVLDDSVMWIIYEFTWV
jgi:hypothetical protein